MRSCLSAFLFTLLLIGAVVGVGALAMGQVRTGVCAEQPFRVGVSLVGGALLLAAILIAIISLVNLELFEKGLSGAQVVVMAASLTIVGFGVASFISFRTAHESCPRLDLADELQNVCSGFGIAAGMGSAPDRSGSKLSAGADNTAFKVLSVPVADAASSPENATRLVVLADDGEPIAWGERASQLWKPASVNDVGLVVCVGAAVQEHLETCRYGGGIKINRDQESIPVRLVDGQTGQTLASDVLVAQPPACQPLGLQDLPRLKAKVSFEELQSWVTNALTVEAASTAQAASPTEIQSSPTPWPTATILPSSTPIPEVTGVVKTGSRLRAGPSTDDKIIGGLVKDDKVIILGANPSRTWLKILTSQGETAWIFGELVKPSVPLDQLPAVP